MAKTDARSILDLVIVLISFLHAMFMKIGENDSAHKLVKLLKASLEFDLIWFFTLPKIYIV